MKIGFRNIKTAIAVFLCVVISRILNLDYAFYAVIAAIIAMESTISRSFITGKNRMLGTIVGAIVGLCFALIKPGSALLCAIGIIIIIFLLNKLKWSKSVTIAGIVFTAIMVNMNGKNPWQYSLNRIIDTFIGISIAVLVNYFIVPPNGLNKLHEHSLSLADNLSKTIDNEIDDIKSDEIASLCKQYEALKDELKVQEEDFKFRKKEAIELENIKEAMCLYDEIICHLKVMKSIQNAHGLSKTIIDEEFECKSEGKDAGKNAAMYIEYNLEIIKNSLEDIKKLLMLPVNGEMRK